MLLQTLLLLVLIVGIQAEIDRIRNFKIEIKREKAEEHELSKRQETSAAQTSAFSLKSQKQTFPEEMTAGFEAFGKQFSLKLKRNDDLISKDLRIQDEEGNIETDFGVAYNGISLQIHEKNGKIIETSVPFARFIATLKDDDILLQGGFEWEKNFFKLTNGNHPSIKYHVSPIEISLLKRGDSEMAMKSKSIKSADDDLVILRESMDPRRKKTFGFSFNSGSNSTIPFRCGHDDVTFNNDPRGVGNDFVKKLSNYKQHQNHHQDNENHPVIKNDKINPLTAQYYLAKRMAATENPSESGCPVDRKVLYIGVAADSAYLSKFDGNRQAAVSNILTDFNLVSAIYEKTFNIELGIVSITILSKSDGKKTNNAVPWDLPCNTVTIGDRLNAFSKWRDGQNKDTGKYCELL